jgi:hypothetical protein
VNLKLLCNNRTEACLKKQHENSWIWNCLIPTTTNSDLEKNNKEISGLKNKKGNGCGYFGVRSSTLKRKAKRETE